MAKGDIGRQAAADVIKGIGSVADAMPTTVKENAAVQSSIDSAAEAARKNPIMERLGEPTFSLGDGRTFPAKDSKGNLIANTVQGTLGQAHFNLGGVTLTANIYISTVTSNGQAADTVRFSLPKAITVPKDSPQANADAADFKDRMLDMFENWQSKLDASQLVRHVAKSTSGVRVRTRTVATS